MVLPEEQLVGLSEVLDRGNLCQDFGQAVTQQPFEGFALDADQVRKREDLGDL